MAPKNTSWSTQSLVAAWQKNEGMDDWDDFSSKMLAHADCPDGYSDSDLRRQIGLLRSQFKRAGYKAPDAPKAPTKRKGNVLRNVAEHLGLEPLE